MKNKQLLVKTTWWILTFSKQVHPSHLWQILTAWEQSPTPSTQGLRELKLGCWEYVITRHFPSVWFRLPIDGKRPFRSPWLGCTNERWMFCYPAGLDSVTGVVILPVTWNLRKRKITHHYYYLESNCLITAHYSKHFPSNIWFNPHKNLKRYYSYLQASLMTQDDKESAPAM